MKLKTIVILSEFANPAIGQLSVDAINSNPGGNFVTSIP
jgi:hypothetical protein